ncbi:MMPL family transporter [Natrialbaceae archaeon AArc-T1-2]|uniref:MMPL family transporter n=1 Tax=Natrialbaceae archaeon AArc-T1-2 TaxID=3053904 RepID=UPI00255ABABA|nr:MMPL family transporter [Natrialbaceae archaeon AArc-T1-2]WIV67580.1 MMPL family transporter [Natrialbaceae archaeon AArc-T1-2]
MTGDRVERYANAIVSHSRLVVVAVLIVTLVVAAGAAVGETEDAGIGEFETDSPETDALEEIEATYGTDDAVVAQLVVREEDGDVLTRASLLEGLSLQQDVRDDPALNATLEDEGFLAFENAVATAGIRGEQFEELNESAAELEAEFEAFNETAETLEDDFEALNETADELDEQEAEIASREAALERSSDRLERDADRLAEDRTQLEADRADLEERVETLSAALHETVELQTAYDEADAETEREAIDEAIEQTWTDAAAEADLDPQQREAFEAVGTEVRELTTEGGGDPPAEDAIERGVAGVLEDEFEDLEQRGQELDERAQEIEERSERIDDRSRELASDAGELGEAREAFGERADDLEERADELEAWGEDLQQRAEDLEAEFEAAEEADEPSLEEQIEYLEGLTESEFEELLADVLDPDADESEDAYEFLPTDYDPGSTTAESRIALLFQVDDSGPDDDPQAAYDAQVEIDALVEERFDDAFVFGQGISDEASANAVGDSFAIITPVALVLVLVVLAVTYRDVVDVLIGLVGIGVVMAWLAGIMGWLEIPMSQLLIAVPFLLIGLSIDYALHVVMRYREARAGVLSAIEGESTDGGTVGVAAGMGLGLGGVVLALGAATVSTSVGFLSNVVSPLPAIQDFAVLSAGGIVATFVAFGVFVPALKVEVDGVLENRVGRDRAKSPFGVDTGAANRALRGVASVARRAPLAVVAVALVLAIGGAYGATGIDTEFNEADFLPEDAPDWAQSLPGPLAPETYTIADDAEYIGENFRDADSQTQILIRGDVTDPDTLAAIDDATADVDGDGTILVGPDGDPAIEGPHTVIREVAADNETVAAALEDRDATGNDLPDEDVAGFYDRLFEVDPDRAEEALYRTDDGDYETARLLVDVRGDAAAQDVADDSRDLAGAIEDGGSVTAVATGGPVTTAVVQDALLETLVQAFAVTLVVILGFLTVLYWVRHRSLSLGVVTLAPVVAALAWLLGTMAILEVPFNSETAVITSLAIGLGVDYSIHLGERFVAERSDREHSRTDADASDDLGEAITATVTGTGGALLGSAATTAAGFGVLALALAPPLQRFGLVTGLSIVFAFVACVVVLPCLLVVRERLLERWIRYR